MSSERYPTKSFTLVELLVVMGIIAVLAGLGIVGMLTFQRVVEVDGATQEFIGNLKTYQNMAINSASSRVYSSGSGQLAGRVDGYAVQFGDGGYELRYCLDADDVNGNFDCQGVEIAEPKSSQYSQVNFATTSDCSLILFERLSGLVYAMNSDFAAPDSTGICEVQITHSAVGVPRTVEINLTENTYILK